MPIVFDQRKSEINAKVRALPFEMVEDFDWTSAAIIEDVRQAYPERRYQALGMLGGALHMVVYALIGADVRVISLRRASRKEREKYAKKAQSIPRR